MKTDVHVLSYLAHFFLEREIFQTKCVEKIKTHISCSATYFFFLNCTIYEIVWENTVERRRPQTTIKLMRIARCITNATNTHSQYGTLTFFHYNSGCTNAPRCYVVRTLPALLIFHLSCRLLHDLLSPSSSVV